MNTQLPGDTEFQIINYLYQFKGDNKFYELDETMRNVDSAREKYLSIYTLRDRAFIATDSEVYFYDDEQQIASHFNSAGSIRAKILPKGIEAVEKMLLKGQEA